MICCEQKNACQSDVQSPPDTLLKFCSHTKLLLIRVTVTGKSVTIKAGSVLHWRHGHLTKDIKVHLKIVKKNSYEKY
jgi:hypothetical protein